MPGLEPLAELQIVLIFAPDESVDIDMAADAILGKGGLEQLVVGHVLEAGLAAPIDARDGDALGEDVLAQLTGHGTGAGLLDFGQIHIQRVVEEGKELVLRNEVCGIHHSNGGIWSRPHDDCVSFAGCVGVGLLQVFSWWQNDQRKNVEPGKQIRKCRNANSRDV